MKSYSTVQLGAIFGVSMETINNWIDENRFIGISRENQEQIKELTVWASHGKSFTVSEIQEMYEKIQERLIVNREMHNNV